MAQLTGVAKHRALFKLRGLLTWRRYTAERGRVIGMLFALLFFVPMILGLAFASWAGYVNAPDAWPFQIAGIVLVVLWFVWIVFPILVSPLSEGVSLEQLLIYPLARRDLVLSTMVGSLYDYTIYLISPFFIALIVGFGGFGRISLPASSMLLIPLLLIVTILAYAHMIVTSQLAMTALGGILQSRRMRDIAIALLSISGIGCWVFSQAIPVVVERFETSFSAEQILNLDLLSVLRWLPTGALASAIQGAASGSIDQSLLWLGYSIGWLVLLSWLWGVLLDRLLTGEGFLINFMPAKEPTTVRAASRRDWSWLEKWFSAETIAIARKEFQMAWRVPQRRLNTLILFLTPVIAIIAPLFTIEEATNFLTDTNTFIAFPVYSLFIFWALSQNMLGWEHTGLPTLLTTPVDRQRIFLGKSLMMVALAAIPLLTLTAIGLITFRNPLYLLWLLLALLIGLPILAVGSVVSAMFPYPVQLDYERNRNSFTRAGCLAALMIMIPVPIIMVLLNLPLLGAFAVYRFLPQFSWAVVPLAIVGAAVAVSSFWYGTRWAGDLLLNREPEAIEDARPTKGD